MFCYYYCWLFLDHKRLNVHSFVYSFCELVWCCSWPMFYSKRSFHPLSISLFLFLYIHIYMNIVLAIHSTNMRSAAYPYGKKFPNICGDIKERKSKKSKEILLKKKRSACIHTYVYERTSTYFKNLASILYRKKFSVCVSPFYFNLLPLSIFRYTFTNTQIDNNNKSSSNFHYLITPPDLKIDCL